MAEKELRKELDDIVSELREISSELRPRLSTFKKIGKPVVLVVAGFIGVKIALRILRAILSLLWRNMLLIAAILLFVVVRFNQLHARKPE
ncbi:MAG TPA: hypothetical protein VN416_07305 [Desulfomonilia bacterium]|jgi:phage-related minor tail protein|nr:hypothetical protein [Desulfomonilia bacterium]